jgi:hypothetical protein
MGHRAAERTAPNQMTERPKAHKCDILEVVVVLCTEYKYIVVRPSLLRTTYEALLLSGQPGRGDRQREAAALSDIQTSYQHSRPKELLISGPSNPYLQHLYTHLLIGTEMCKYATAVPT